MHYLFASESLGQQAALLAEIVEAIGGDGQVETYRNVGHFSARLRRHNGRGIMILLASDPRDLARLSENREVVLEADVILLVSDGAQDTIATAHSLRPNYLGRTDCDLDKVVPVLKRLLQKRGRRAEAAKAPGT
jgi:hypothetical protein